MNLAHRTKTLLLGALLAATALAAGCSGTATPVIPEPSNLPAETRAVSVFFATGRTLVEEPRVVDTADVYRRTLEELLEASPEINAKIAIVQPEAEVKGISVKDGHAVIDWSPTVLDFEAEDGEETLALAAFLMTLGQFPEIEKVSFSVEGKTAGEVDGKDIEHFWGRVSLKGQPWDVLRPPSKEEGAARVEEEAVTPETAEAPVGGALEAPTDDGSSK